MKIPVFHTTFDSIESILNEFCSIVVPEEESAQLSRIYLRQFSCPLTGHTVKFDRTYQRLTVSHDRGKSLMFDLAEIIEVFGLVQKDKSVCVHRLNAVKDLLITQLQMMGIQLPRVSDNISRTQNRICDALTHLAAHLRDGLFSGADLQSISFRSQWSGHPEDPFTFEIFDANLSTSIRLDLGFIISEIGKVPQGWIDIFQGFGKNQDNLCWVFKKSLPQTDVFSFLAFTWGYLHKCRISQELEKMAPDLKQFWSVSSAKVSSSLGADSVMTLPYSSQCNVPFKAYFIFGNLSKDFALTVYVENQEYAGSSQFRKLIHKSTQAIDLKTLIADLEAWTHHSFSR